MRVDHYDLDIFAVESLSRVGYVVSDTFGDGDGLVLLLARPCFRWCAVPPRPALLEARPLSVPRPSAPCC